jgi:16S rRNA (uracil1498-N3)-methyltransferase
MHRCFVDPSDWEGPDLLLSNEEAHHLFHVLRAADGDTVEVFDGRGRLGTAVVASSPTGRHAGGGRGGRARLSLLRESRVPPPRVALTLVQALPKGRRMDLIVEKATEIGASGIVPVVTQRVERRLTASQRRERQARWARIALSAARQCGSAWIPAVGPVVALADFLRGEHGFDLLLVGALGDDAQPLHSALGREGEREPAAIALLVGPEGDLTPAELRAVIGAGAVPVRFGERVFRVETAAIYGLSVLAYEFLRAASATGSLPGSRSGSGSG